MISKVILLGLLLTVTTPLLESGEGGGVSAEAEAMASKKGSVPASLCISISRSTPRTRMSLC